MRSNCYNITYADDFVHDELNKDEQDKFKKHIETCDECRNEVGRLRQISESLNAAYSLHLDETFNYRIVNNLRQEEREEGRMEIRIAFEDIVISLATLFALVVLGIQVFDRPTVSQTEMVGSLTNIEKSSLDQENLSNDQVLELVLRSK